jgi:hypothetical protein
MYKIKLNLIWLILLININLIICQKNEKNFPPKIEWELIDYFDSLKHNPIGFEEYLISKEEHIPIKDISNYNFKNQSINSTINNISKYNSQLSYLIGVCENRFINGIWIDYFYNAKYILRIYICLDTPVISCCGWGGEFIANNTLIPDVRNKNYEIIKDIKEYSVFQYLVPIPKSYYFDYENKKLDSLKRDIGRRNNMKKKK